MPSHPAKNGWEALLKTTLIVDNDRAALGLAGIILEKMGYSVLKARNAEEALALFQANKPLDLAITDVMLGSMDGYRLGDLLRANQPGIKLLFISGDPTGLPLRGTSATAGSRLLRKPFHPHEMKDMVTALMLPAVQRPDA